MEIHPEKEREVREFEIDFKKYFIENDTFYSEVGSGFGEPGGIPHEEFPGVPPGLSDAIFVAYVCPEGWGHE